MLFKKYKGGGGILEYLHVFSKICGSTSVRTTNQNMSFQQIRIQNFLKVYEDFVNKYICEVICPFENIVMILFSGI